MRTKLITSLGFALGVCLLPAVGVAQIGPGSPGSGWTRTIDQAVTPYDTFETWYSSGNAPNTTVYHDFNNWFIVDAEKTDADLYFPPWLSPFGTVGTTNTYTSRSAPANSGGIAQFNLHWEWANTTSQGRPGLKETAIQKESIRNYVYKLLLTS